MAVQKVATQVIEDAAITDAKLNTTGTMPAWNGSALTNLPAGGDTENLIIDPFMTQWPEGTSMASHTTGYFNALWRLRPSGSSVVATCSQSTDVPTIAEAGYKIPYASKILITTADASLGATEMMGVEYKVTGPDYAKIHQQAFTFSCWLKIKGGTTAHSGSKVAFSFGSSDNGRTYVEDVTITGDDTWQFCEVNVPANATGTFLFTEADIGLRVTININGGSSRQGTDQTWESALNLNTSASENLADEVNDEIHFTACKLEKGTSATTCTVPPIATVRDQVDYYVQRYEYANEGNEMICSGFQNSTTVSHCQLNYRNYLRTAAPTITHAPAAGFAVSVSGGISSATSFTDNNKGRHGCRFSVTHGAQGAAKDPCNWCRDSTDTCWILIDSRH